MDSGWYDTRLFEYSREEWWIVFRHIRPNGTQEQFDQSWDEFQAMKAAKELH